VTRSAFARKRRSVEKLKGILQPHFRAQPERKVAGGHDLVVERAELLLVDDRLQAFHIGGERVLQILGPEEGRVFEAGAEDALVPFADHAHIRGEIVADTDEVWEKFAVLSTHGEVLLVFLHRRDEDFLGDFEEFLAEAPEEWNRVFDEIEVFVDDVRIQLDRSVEIVFKRVDSGDHLLTAFFLVEDDMVVVEALHEVRGVVDGDLSGAHEAVSPCDGTGGDAPVLEGNDRLVGHRDDPADGPGEAYRGNVPVHALGEDELPDQGGEQFGENFQRRFSGLGYFGVSVLDPVHLDGGEAFDGNALALCEAERRPCRIAVHIERCGPCRALEGVDEILLLVVDVPYH